MTQTNETPPGQAGLDRNCSSHENSNINQNASPAQVQNDVRLRFLAARLHALGPKPLYYFLREIERGAELRQHLEGYARLHADFIAALGGRDFQPPVFPVREA